MKSNSLKVGDIVRFVEPELNLGIEVLIKKALPNDVFRFTIGGRVYEVPASNLCLKWSG